jgi:PAS domain S-box-containing protein
VILKQVSEWNIQITFLKNVLLPVLVVVLACLFVSQWESYFVALGLGFVLAAALYSYLGLLDRSYRFALEAISKRQAEREELVKKLEFEKARFETIFNQIPAAMSILEAPTGKVIIANPQFGTLFGIDHKGPFADIQKDRYKVLDSQGNVLHEKDWNVWAVLKTGKTLSRDVEIVRPDGKRLFITSTIVPVCDGAGKILAAASILIDNTDQKKARSALMESEHRFRHLADALPQIVWTAEAGGTIDYYNQQWNNYFGPSMDGSPVSWSKVIHPEDLQRAEERWNHCLKVGEIYHMAYRLKGQEGEYRWFLTRGIPSVDESGAIVRWFGTCTDIDQQKNLQKRLERAIAYRDDFLSVASHELKTPLTSLKLQLQMVKKRMKVQSTEKTMERIHGTVDQCLHQSGRLELLVDDLLDVSRIRAGHMKFHFEPLCLVQLVRATIERLQEQLNLAGVKVQIVAPIDLPVVCDRFRMEQVFANLLTNACKYGNGSPVLVRVERVGGEAKVAVKDFGMGIPRDKFTAIFEPFERAVGSNNISGLGLGLFISQQIVMAHQGQISVDSEVNQYSQFSVSIPMDLKPTPEVLPEPQQPFLPLSPA